MLTSAETPFFIVGAPRSGTTMLRLMLNAHSRLAVPFESAFIPEFYRRVGDYGDLALSDNAARLLEDIRRSSHVSRGQLIPDPDAVLALAPKTYADLVRTIFALHASRKGKARWGDKTPGHGRDLDVLWKLFPESKFVHLVRDGRDVALSNRTLSWGIPNLPRLAAEWRWETLLTRKLGRMIEPNYLEVRYEDLVQEPERELRRICAHIEEPYEASMLGYHLTARDELPRESLRWHANSVLPPDRSKVFQWRHAMSRTDRIIFEQHGGDALDEFGYPRECHAATLASRARMLMYAVRGR